MEASERSWGHHVSGEFSFAQSGVQEMFHSWDCTPALRGMGHEKFPSSCYSSLNARHVENAATRGEFQGGLGSSGITGADISNWLPRAVWLLPICSRWEVSIQWISPLLTSSEPGLWEEWTPSGRNRLHLLSCKTSSYKFPEPSRTAEDRGRSNLDLHWIPYHCLPPLNLHGELLQANKRKTDNQTDKQAKRFPRIWLWFGIASLMAQQVKNPLAMQEAQETWVWSLSWEVPLEKSIAAHSSVLSWEILWTKEPSGPQSIASQRVGHDWATEHTHRAPWSSKKYRL